MSYKITIQPASEPITLLEAKQQCKVEHSAEDTLIASYIMAAREMAEHTTGRALITQTLELTLNGFGYRSIQLPVSPVQSISSIEYVDQDGATQILPTSVYALDNSGQGSHYVRLKNSQSWPSTRDQFDAVKITFVAGYGDASDVPGAVKNWILLAVDSLYENRGLINNMQTYALAENFCAALLDTVKIWRV